MDEEKIIIALIGAMGGALITHLLYRSKLKKEQKLKIIGAITQERVNGINDIKEIIRELKVYERIDIVHPEFHITDPLTYPSIMENYKNLDKYCDKLLSLRGKYDDLLNIDCLMYLLASSQYVFELQKVAHIFSENKDLPLLGTILYPEIESWSMHFKDKLNSFLNNPPLKYEKRTGLYYKIRLRILTYKVQHTILYKKFIKGTDLDDCNIGKLFLEKHKNELENKKKNKKQKSIKG